MFNVLAVSLVYYLGNGNECGIPIMNWTIVYFILVSFRSLSNLVKYYVNRDLYDYQGWF